MCYVLVQDFVSCDRACCLHYSQDHLLPITLVIFVFCRLMCNILMHVVVLRWPRGDDRTLKSNEELTSPCALSVFAGLCATFFARSHWCYVETINSFLLLSLVSRSRWTTGCGTGSDNATRRTSICTTTCWVKRAPSSPLAFYPIPVSIARSHAFNHRKQKSSNKDKAPICTAVRHNLMLISKVLPEFKRIFFFLRMV